ncbi:MAG: TIGR00725 family protein [Myxococcales bacterium]|nr:TIGR00725 family protein [Myxococcales bacterium]
MRRRVVAVIGNGAAPPEICAIAEELGERLVERGYRLVTGGLGGVMAAASRGARRASSYREGDVLGILPGSDPSEANPHVDVAIPSGLGIARNALVVQSADAVIAVGGGSGTLSEMAMAWQLGKLVVGVAAPGWSERLAGSPIDERRDDTVERAASAEEAVEIVARRLS